MNLLDGLTGSGTTLQRAPQWRWRAGGADAVGPGRLPWRACWQSPARPLGRRRMT